MANTQRVIYVAASRGQAYTLANLLAEHGIAARVANDFAGDVYAGDAATGRNAPSIIVPAEDVERAGEILDDAARQIEEQGGSEELTRLESAAESDDHWPVCPHCGRGRLTSCPVCQTAGTHFATAFMPDLGPSAEQPAEDTSLFVLCPTCDEPFAAQFPAVCEWCNHRFRDGYEPPEATRKPSQFSSVDIGSRVVIVTAGLVAFLAALFAWFYYVLH